MNPDPEKLRQQQQVSEQAAEARLEQSSQSGQQFNSLEEMIRLDAEQNPVPPAVAERLKESIAREPAPARSWWQRLLGRT